MQTEKISFELNFLIVLPAAILTAIILTFMTAGYSGVEEGAEYSFEDSKSITLHSSTLGALCGMNDLSLLGSGVLFAG